MERNERNEKSRKMNDDAFAGFLKLWLTPASKTPASTPEIDEYLKFLSTVEPVEVPVSRKRGRSAGCGEVLRAGVQLDRAA